jgi:hypothetical protein
MVTLRGRVVHLGTADPQNLFANARLFAQGESQPLPCGALTVAYDVVYGGQREVLVIEVAMPHAGVRNMAVPPQSDELAVEKSISTPLGGTGPGPAAAGAQESGGRVSRRFHRQTLRKRLR